MSDGVLHLLALATATLAMFAFALVNDSHWKQLFRATPHTAKLRTGGRVAGMAALSLSFCLCALADPISMALLVWPMLLAVAAALVAAFLTLQARYGAPPKRRAS